MNTRIVEEITSNQTSLGIEFGSTRIKAVLVNKDNDIIATGSHQWENKWIDGIWTYDENDIWLGLQQCYQDLKNKVQQTYNITLKSVGGIGISGMMHGYVALDHQNQLLVPFRTWRNTITEEASSSLSSLFTFHIPQRWTIAHLYQAILNKELHVPKLSYVTTLAGYIHYMLTGEKVVGIGEASGIFPIDRTTKNYDQTMITAFNTLVQQQLPKPVEQLLPQVLVAGETAGYISKKGALLLDPSGDLQSEIVCAPPEGDAGTGMVATNAIDVRTGNVSAGTSVFAMIVLEKDLSKPYDMIDVVTTPEGHTVAMVHVNNCTSDINAWANLFQDTLAAFGVPVTTDTLYETLFNKALEGDPNSGDILTYNYFSGEHITELDEGRPLLIRNSTSSFTVANLMKANLFSALATLRIGMNVLLKEEHIEVDSITGHGGLFKTPVVGQVMLASAIQTPITTLQTAGEGGPYGMAVLTNYVQAKDEYVNLSEYLNEKAFKDVVKVTEQPQEQLVEDFNQYVQRYQKGLAIEQEAVKSFK